MKAKTKHWIATMECTVIKSVSLSACTEEEARNNPWKYATDEHEIAMNDWEVKQLDPNE